MTSKSEAQPEKALKEGSPAQDEYVVWLANKRNGGAGRMSPEEVSETEAAIHSIVGLGVAVNNYISQFNGLVLWRVVCSKGQAEETSKLDGVSPHSAALTSRCLQRKG